RKRKRTATGEPLYRSQRQLSSKAAASQNGFVCTDESCLGGVRRPHGHDFLHERDDLLFGRAPALTGAAILRHALAWRLSLPRTLGIDFQIAGQVSGDC